MSRQVRSADMAENAWSLRSIPTFVSGAAATAAAMAATLGTGAGTPRSHLIEPILRAWARAWLFPAGVRLEVEGREHLAVGRSYVMVSNHLSNLDPIVHFAGVRLPLRFLAMRELFDIPLLGSALRRIGMIEVDRNQPDAAGIARGVERALADGASVFVFPEGQTSHDGSLNRFHLGAFVLAIEHGVPIVPIAIIGTREVWTPGSNAIHRGVVRLVIHEPIDTQDLTRLDAIGLRDKSRSAIASARGESVYRKEA